jgi:nucleoside-diphosphate-sugar epimerase
MFAVRMMYEKSLSKVNGMNPVELFYENSIILVTGGNGFLGCVLIEKLLRCFDVKRIFVLLRAKNNENFEQRSKTFFDKKVKEKRRKKRQRHFIVCYVHFNIL